MTKTLLRILTACIMTWSVVGPSISTNNSLLNKILNSATPNAFAECTATLGVCNLYSEYNGPLAEDPNNISHTINYGLHISENFASTDITGPVTFSATSNSQCTISPTTMTYATGNDYQSFSITAIDDTLVEPNQNCELTFTPLSGGAGFVNVPFIDTVSITDNDTYLDEFPSSPIHSKTITSNFDYFSYHNLSFPSDTEIDIHLSPGSASDCTFVLNSKSFPASSWFLDYSYTITAIDDGVADFGDNCGVQIEDLTQGYGVMQTNGYTVLDNTGGPPAPTANPTRVGYSVIEPDGGTLEPSLSQDGSYMSFTTYSGNIIPGSSTGSGQIGRYNSATGLSTLVSSTSTGIIGNGLSTSSSISANGRFVVFGSNSTNLTPGLDPGNLSFRIFLKDMQTGAVEHISEVSGGGQSTGNCGFSSMSADARYVSFDCFGDDIVAGDVNGFPDAFVRDRQTGITTLVSTDSTGAQSNDDSYLGTSMSGDGNFVIFSSYASNLIPGDTNSSNDVFKKNLSTGAIERVNLAYNNAEGNTGSNGATYSRVSSYTGRFIAFSSASINLISGDLNGVADVFVRDTVNNVVTLVSRNSTGFYPSSASGNNGIAISDDGTKVVYTSSATDIAPPDNNGYLEDVFVADLTALTTQIKSVNAVNSQANNASYNPSIARNGGYVAFESLANNIIASDTNGQSDVFLITVTYSGGTCGVPNGSICAALNLQNGVITTKFISKSDYTTTTGSPAYNLNTFTPITSFNMYLDGDFATNGTTNPIASTTQQIVKGNFYYGIANGSGTNFNTTITSTNFNRSGVVLTLCDNPTPQPCGTNKLSLDSFTTTASTSNNYQGQTNSGNSIDLLTQQITTMSDATTTGVSDPTTLVQFDTGSGRGEYFKAIQYNFTVPPFTPVGTFTSTFIFTTTAL
jgi:hypothetical protein